MLQLAGLPADRACSRSSCTRWSTTSTSGTSSCCSLFLVIVAAARLRVRGPPLPLREPRRTSSIPTSTATATSCRRCSGSGCTGAPFAVLLLVLSYALLGARARRRLAQPARAPRAARMDARAAGRSPARPARCSSPPAAGSTTTRTSLNPYLTRSTMRQRAPGRLRAQRYKALAGAPQPHRSPPSTSRSTSSRSGSSARVAGHADAGQPDGAADRRPLRRSIRAAARVHAIDFGVPARLADDEPPMRWHHYVLATPLAPGATTDLPLRPRVRRARVPQQRRRPGRARQRHVPQSGPDARDVADPELRLRRRRASSPPTATAGNSASRRGRGCTTSTTGRGTCRAR